MNKEKNQPEREPKKPKTHEESVAEEIAKQRARLEASKDDSLQAALYEDELAKQRRRSVIQQQIISSQTKGRQGIPGIREHVDFDQTLQRAHRKKTAEERVRTISETAQSESDTAFASARQETLAVAVAAAEAIQADPNVGIVVMTGTNTEKRLISHKTYRRKVIRGGQQVNEEATKRRYFGKETTDQHETLAYGWEIPIKPEFSDPGSRMVLCEDGTIMTLRAQEKPTAAIGTMRFQPGHGVDNAAFMKPKQAGQPEKIVLIADHSGYSPLTESLSSDYATGPLPINNPEGAAQMAMRREMAIHDGLAQLLASNDIK